MQILSPFKRNQLCLISFLTTFLPRPPLRSFGGFKGWEVKGAELPGWTACLDAYMYNIQVLSFLDDLPDDTWPEPDPKDPLSLVDKVDTTSLKSLYYVCAMCIQNHSCYIMLT